MDATAPRVVFDCMIYTQALISERGPAGLCLNHVRLGALRLVWSDYVLQEIRELPLKLPARLLVTPERVDAFISAIAPYAEHRASVPPLYENPFDPDDSHYVNLALAAAANIITSRDKDLLRLMDDSIPEGHDFHGRFPDLRILTPETLLELLGVGH